MAVPWLKLGEGTIEAWRPNVVVDVGRSVIVPPAPDPAAGRLRAASRTRSVHGAPAPPTVFR